MGTAEQCRKGQVELERGKFWDSDEVALDSVALKTVALASLLSWTCSAMLTTYSTGQSMRSHQWECVAWPWNERPFVAPTLQMQHGAISSFQNSPKHSTLPKLLKLS